MRVRGEKRKSRTHDCRRGCAFRGPTPDFGPTQLVRTCELQPLKTLALRMFSDTFRRAVGGRWGNTHVLAVIFVRPEFSGAEKAPSCLSLWLLAHTATQVVVAEGSLASNQGVQRKPALPHSFITLDATRPYTGHDQPIPWLCFLVRPFLIHHLEAPSVGWPNPKKAFNRAPNPKSSGKPPTKMIYPPKWKQLAMVILGAGILINPHMLLNLL